MQRTSSTDYFTMSPNSRSRSTIPIPPGSPITCLRSAICWDSVLLLAFGTLVRLGSLAWKSPPVIRCWKNSSAASFPPSKLLHIGMKSCGWPHPSNRAPSPPRSCCASWVPTHVRTHSLWPYEKSGNWNAHYFCWSSSRTSNCESAFMLVWTKGELRDRTYENQQHRASGLNLVVAAIALWNTVYLERAIKALQERSYAFDQQLLAHLSPLKWEYINLTGDYHWRRDGGLRNRKLRPLRSRPLPTDFDP